MHDSADGSGSDWLTTGEVAKRLGFVRSTVRQAARRGAFGELARLVETPRGPTWLLHPSLADLDVYRRYVPAPGNPGWRPTEEGES